LTNGPKQKLIAKFENGTPSSSVMAAKVYSAQVNAHGNIIVCGDTIARNSYRVVFTGTYNECLRYKAQNS